MRLCDQARFKMWAEEVCLHLCTTNLHISWQVSSLSSEIHTTSEGYTKGTDTQSNDTDRIKGIMWHDRGAEERG
jgi:hypothetical protein